MTKQVLLIHGAGEGAYEADKKLAASLRESLGSDYEVHYPQMADEENAPYDQWTQQIEQVLAPTSGLVAFVGHSVGASILIKWLCEADMQTSIAGVFLTAMPFWGGDGWRYDGYEELALPDEPAARFPANVPMFLYHSRDDETVPFDHLALFAQAFPKANVRQLDVGGHQLGDDLSTVAHDIKSLG